LIIFIFFLLIKSANKFYTYKLDNEPAEYGISAGFYAPGKRAFVGLGVWLETTLLPGRIQLDPPGILMPELTGPGTFSNVSSKIWYMAKRRNHNYKWVPSKDAKIEPFSVDLSGDSSGLPIIVGRIRRNGTTLLGNVTPFMGVMYYVDENGMSKSASSGYEVLTCWTCKSENYFFGF
jgi:hypothetical protein